MKFYVETSQFQRLVDVACRFSAARSPDERFRIIRILVDAYGRVVVSSRSPAGESAKLHMQSVKFDEAGAFCVDSRLFQAAVKTVRGDKMAVEKTGNMCSVVFAGGTTKMPVSDAELTLSGEQPTTGELAVDTESFQAGRPRECRGEREHGFLLDRDARWQGIAGVCGQVAWPGLCGLRSAC